MVMGSGTTLDPLSSSTANRLPFPKAARESGAFKWGLFSFYGTVFYFLLRPIAGAKSLMMSPGHSAIRLIMGPYTKLSRKITMVTTSCRLTVLHALADLTPDSALPAKGVVTITQRVLN